MLWHAVHIRLSNVFGSLCHQRLLQVFNTTKSYSLMELLLEPTHHRCLRHQNATSWLYKQYARVCGKRSARVLRLILRSCLAVPILARAIAGQNSAAATNNVCLFLAHVPTTHVMIKISYMLGPSCKGGFCSASSCTPSNCTQMPRPPSNCMAQPFAKAMQFSDKCDIG